MVYIYWRLNFRSSAAHDIRFEQFRCFLSRWRSGPASVLGDASFRGERGGYDDKVKRILNKRC
jgi:hypothetical protein